MIETNKDNYSMQDLLSLMSFLRSDNGCPWDRKQTHQSIKKNVIEEAYEVVDAIDSNTPERLSDELGDLLLQVVFHSQMADESGEFDFCEVVDHLCKKLISRHTHLFGEQLDHADSPEKVLALWEKNKKSEKKQRKQTQTMIEIPRVLPALQRAYKIQKKAKQVGFDWEERCDVIAKIEEEIIEVEEAFQKLEISEKYEKDNNISIDNKIESNTNIEKSIITSSESSESIKNNEQVISIKANFPSENKKESIEKVNESIENKKELEMEIGDLLFAVVNYARFLDVEPEIALDKANQKFIKRFEFVEENVLSSGKKMEHLSLVELDQIWNEAKADEKNKKRGKN